MNNSATDYHVLESIGVIHTPYTDKAPHQSHIDIDGEFILVLNSKYTSGLLFLERFKYLYVIYYLDRIIRDHQLLVVPPLSENKTVGVFASRSPNRPNPIGLSVVRIKKIVNNRIYISGMDAFDGTPILDIKPYIKDLDSKNDANYGWIDTQENLKHLDRHIKGIPHKH